MMGLFDLGNVISRTGFRSQVLHNLEGKSHRLIMQTKIPFSKKTVIFVYLLKIIWKETQ